MLGTPYSLDATVCGRHATATPHPVSLESYVHVPGTQNFRRRGWHRNAAIKRAMHRHPWGRGTSQAASGDLSPLGKVFFASVSRSSWPTTTKSSSAKTPFRESWTNKNKVVLRENALQKPPGLQPDRTAPRRSPANRPNEPASATWKARMSESSRQIAKI